MENSAFTPHASVLSRSALHVYITGPVTPQPLPKSNFNPNRKRSGLLNLMSLEAAEVALQKSVEVEAENTAILSLPESVRPLNSAPAV